VTTATPKPGKLREILLAVIFMTVATVFTLVAGEIIMRVVASQRLIYNIEMVKYAKELKMRDPTGQASHVHRPNASAHLMGVDISLNSLGQRGPELITPRDPNRKRVLVFGSSITMGWGVPFEETFTATTERELNTQKPFGTNISFEFANSGIGNYNTVFQYALFKRQYPVVKPDMVVLHYFISDVEPRSRGRNSFVLEHSYLADFCFDRWTQLKQRLSGNYKDLFTFYNDLYVDDSQPWQETQKLITEMRDTTARDGVPFVIMIIPDIHDLTPGTRYKALYTKMETTFRGLGIPTVNTFDAFQREFGDDVTKLWIQSDDPHPNAKGHALMADVLYHYMVEADPLKLKATAKVLPRSNAL
jgi:lysophospholipase L1-like esterase